MDELTVGTTYGQVYARSEGHNSAPLVLAVHGFSQRNGWQSWEPLMRPLAEAGYFVVSVDMPGWGQSTVTSFDPLDAAQSVGVLEAVVEALNYESAAAIMEKSWGGGLALTMALDRPQMVQKLILTAPAFMDVDRLAYLTQPVLLAWAEDDKTIPISLAKRYEATVSDLELVTYETGGHSAAPNNAGDFAPRAIEFLNKLDVETTT